MPTYDYHCAACGHRFEVVHGVYGTGPDACPSCGSGPVRKRFVPPTIHFKGTGWAKKERTSAAGSSKGGGSGSDENGASPGAGSPSTAGSGSGSESGGTSDGAKGGAAETSATSNAGASD